MTDPAPFKPAIKICTPLIAGNRQDLRLQIEANCTIRIEVPISDEATALMTVDEFRKAEISLRPLSPPDTEGNRVEVGGDLPPGLSAPAARTEENGAGLIRIPIVRGKVFVFNVWLRNFVVQKSAKAVTIQLKGEPRVRNDPWTLLDQGTSEKVVPEPRITCFTAGGYNPRTGDYTASGYNVVSGDTVMLNWEIDPAGNFELKAGATSLVKGEQKGKGQWIGNVRSGVQDFILEAWADNKPASRDTRQLHIGIISSTQFRPIALAPPDWSPRPDILGLYAHRGRGRLYALLRFGSSRYASLWYTEHGFDPSRANWREAARKRDPVKPNEPLIKPLIPVEAARRPGAIFNDKLFLIGGDCCNPDLAGSNVGFCDLNEDTGLDWQEVGNNEAWSWPKEMNERMGHAVVVVPDEKGDEQHLWVMGGWRQDGGVCDDIWQFNGTVESAWEPVTGLELPRCLFGATATRHAVWTVGGFDSPGGMPNDAVVRRCAIGTKSWDATALPKIPGVKPSDCQYSASVLFSRERDTADKPYGIATLRNENPPRKYFYFEKVASWQENLYFNDVGPEALLPLRNWYHLQSAVFRDAVFFRTLIADENWAGNTITYLVFGPE